MKLPSDASGLWRFLYATLTLFRPLICKLRIEGQRNIPLSGGCIITCNHTAGPDYVFLGYGSTRQLYFMAKAEMFGWNPLFSRFIMAAGAFPVHRGRGDVGAIEHSIEVVRSGRILCMFPEGTRSYSGELKQGKTGAVRIAMMTGVPIVPGAVVNSMAAQRRLLRPWQPRPEVIVRYGKPLFFKGDPADRDATQEAINQVMLATAAMLPPEMRGEWGALLEDAHKK